MCTLQQQLLNRENKTERFIIKMILDNYQNSLTNKRASIKTIYL